MWTSLRMHHVCMTSNGLFHRKLFNIISMWLKITAGFARKFVVCVFYLLKRFFLFEITEFLLHFYASCFFMRFFKDLPGLMA